MLNIEAFQEYLHSPWIVEILFEHNLQPDPGFANINLYYAHIED